MDKKIVEIAKLYAQKVRSYMPVSMVIFYGSYAIDAAAKLFNLVCTVNKCIKQVLLCCENGKRGFYKTC